MKRILATILVLTSLCVCAENQTNAIKIVHGRGHNAEYRLAVYEALVQAMSQVEGVSLQDSRDTSFDTYRSQLGSGEASINVSEVKESLRQMVSAKTHGRVQSYEITQEEFRKDEGQWYVEVDARVPGQYVIGRDPNNLRRMVVMPFRAEGNDATVLDKTVSASSCAETIATKLNENLTHTRKFSMLDRAFNGETMEELSRLDLQNATAEDFGRFRQLLVTDYMIIGTVRVFDQPPVIENKYTGTAHMADGPFVEISYRVILVPTSQLKWADTVRVQYSQATGSSISEMIANAVIVGSDKICDEVINNIYPIRVTDKTTFELVLNQGGKNVRLGDVFDVFAVGNIVRDVTTGESLGAGEELIARIRVTRVTPKTSYAQVFEGTPLADIPVGSIVRRPQPMPVGVQPTVLPDAYDPPAKKPIVHPNGGVRVPWQR